jgi:hypothetical protein
MERDQLRLGFRDRPAAILLQVPSRRADMGQKPAPLLIVRDQLAIQILRAPVEQHAAEIEYHRPDVGHRQLSENAASKCAAMLVVRFPSGNCDMTLSVTSHVKAVNRTQRHSFALIDHQNAALPQENGQARSLG